MRHRTNISAVDKHISEPSGLLSLREDMLGQLSTLYAPKARVSCQACLYESLASGRRQGYHHAAGRCPVPETTENDRPSSWNRHIDHNTPSRQNPSRSQQVAAGAQTDSQTRGLVGEGVRSATSLSRSPYKTGDKYLSLRNSKWLIAAGKFTDN